ncbi:hypothetical protein CKAH01_00135 [Colletotrichum kahawae]|uniref:Uncharacterized protein n=1 Tax=Colletotrichum kahawae TaxID=34407 RepID=A0AAE0DEL5_COLKA|nr:hypothetical protein CKAH01_00135 [Colletotrichum kahawae]
MMLTTGQEPQSTELLPLTVAGEFETHPKGQAKAGRTWAGSPHVNQVEALLEKRESQSQSPRVGGLLELEDEAESGGEQDSERAEEHPEKHETCWVGDGESPDRTNEMRPMPFAVGATAEQKQHHAKPIPHYGKCQAQVLGIITMAARGKRPLYCAVTGVDRALVEIFYRVPSGDLSPPAPTPHTTEPALTPPTVPGPDSCLPLSRSAVTFQLAKRLSTQPQQLEDWQ